MLSESLLFKLPVVVVLTLLLLTGLGYLLAYMVKPSPKEQQDPTLALTERVNQLLPQTQCAQCGYPGCRPYAQAIIEQNVAINQCPPGGEQTVQELAQLLGVSASPLDTSRGETKPPQVVFIDEDICIGCTLCIKACPVDAIVGTAKLMHTVIAEQCTGCELCIPPCPVDCIHIQPIPTTVTNWSWPKPT